MSNVASDRRSVCQPMVLPAALESGDSFDHRANVSAEEDLVGIRRFAGSEGESSLCPSDKVCARARGEVHSERVELGQSVVFALGILQFAFHESKFGSKDACVPTHIPPLQRD